jgi:hypothetical protein
MPCACVVHVVEGLCLRRVECVEHVLLGVGGVWLGAPPSASAGEGAAAGLDEVVAICLASSATSVVRQESPLSARCASIAMAASWGCVAACD